jgi:hypothetical protein
VSAAKEPIKANHLQIFVGFVKMGKKDKKKEKSDPTKLAKKEAKKQKQKDKAAKKNMKVMGVDEEKPIEEILKDMDKQPASATVNIVSCSQPNPRAHATLTAIPRLAGTTQPGNRLLLYPRLTVWLAGT